MSRYSSSSYDIARATGQCAATQKPLEPNETYVACLCEREADEGLDRLDYSVEAWEDGTRPPRLYCFWKTRMPNPEDKRTFVDDEVLLNLFQRLEEDTQPQRISYRFVIGLILMRKKLLKCVNTRQDGEQKVWDVRLKGDSPDAPPVVMIDPEIGDDDVRAVADQLGEVLRGEL